MAGPELFVAADAVSPHGLKLGYAKFTSVAEARRKVAKDNLVGTTLIYKK